MMVSNVTTNNWLSKPASDTKRVQAKPSHFDIDAYGRGFKNKVRARLCQS